MLQTPFLPAKDSEEKLEDRIFSVVNEIGKAEEDGFIHINARDKNVFRIGGIDHPDDNENEYYRLNAKTKNIYSDANRSLAECTSGATLRFITDANQIQIRADLRAAITGMHHFTDRGVYGFDVLVGTGTNRQYCGKVMQTLVWLPEKMQDTVYLPEGIKEVQIDFPMYGGVSNLEIGFPDQARIALPTKRTNHPIAFYGSSITQGGCASRPGNAYPNIICRALDADCRNLGFSGSARGEQSIAEYIGGLELGCFVMDYDYNSITVEELAERHEPFFKTVRRAQPDLPILMLPHVWSYPDGESDYQRVAVVKQTYENAVANGDQNVYFLDSSDFFRGEMRDLCTVDALHPNDIGMLIMASEIYKKLIQII